VRAEEVLAALNDGAVFEDVAREYSDGPFGPRGGDLGLFLLGELGPEIDAAVTPLEPGERTGLVETPFGFHVLERYE
jgi:parvulin-like peptidyl-prolyl isomerase